VRGQGGAGSRRLPVPLGTHYLGGVHHSDSLKLPTVESRSEASLDAKQRCQSRTWGCFLKLPTVESRSEASPDAKRRCQGRTWGCFLVKFLEVVHLDIAMRKEETCHYQIECTSK
jgi:hypothetical protein